MSKSTESLRQIRIAAPCSASWDDMAGDDRVRFCRDCKLNVFNLSDMSEKEAARMVEDRQGRLCVTFYRRSDGTILTENCPVGLRAIRRGLVRAAGAGVFMLGLVFRISSLLAGESGSSGLRLGALEPFAAVRNWVSPAPARPSFAMGRIALPPNFGAVSGAAPPGQSEKTAGSSCER